MCQPHDGHRDQLPGDRLESLFDRLFPESQRLARQAVGKQHFRYLDEDDIAVSACTKLLCEILRSSQQMTEDEQLSLLTLIIRQKMVDLLRRSRAVKRGGGRVRGESGFEHLADLTNGAGIQLVADQHSHGITAAMERQDQDLLLGELLCEDLRQIAIFKLEGYSNAEIAEKLSVCVRTVERKLRMIRRRWSKKVRK